MKVVEWLRLLGCQKLQKIDLKGNFITEKGLDSLLVWLGSLPDSDFNRENTFDIDLRHNKVRGEIVRRGREEIYCTVRIIR
jgi:hypothetical protein